MERIWYWRLILVVGLIGLAVYAATPSFIYFTSAPECRRSKQCLSDAIPKSLPEARVSFGIDLQGGLHLVMGVDVERAVLNRTDRIADEIVQEMDGEGKKLKSCRRTEDRPVIEIVLESEADWDTLKELLDNKNDAWEIRSHSGDRVTFGMRDTFETQLKEDAVSQAIKTLRNRIDKYGVTEPEVRKRGENSVMIQIAGLTADDEQRVKDEIIGKTALLEFKLADDTSTYFSELHAKGVPEGITLETDAYQGEGGALVSSTYLKGKDKDAIKALVTANPPGVDRMVAYERIEPANPTEDSTWRTWLLHRATPLTGDSLVRAFVAFDNDKNQYYVAMKLDREGAAIFAEFTGNNVKKRMAIVLDEIVDSAPVISERIPNGNVSITLGGGMRNNQQILEDANNLAIVLNAGALPAPVYPQEQRTVGATLGDDAVTKGAQALLASAVIIVLVMLFYYRGSGAIALVAMAANMLFLFAALATFNATLTLPGLAGLALTIGMAVDANIIQFERIREETRLGKTARAAVDAGFDKAFSAIFDANATTFFACVVLLQYGSGPIRGFATTLGIGVVINTFTAVVVPRLFFDYLTRGRRVQKLSI